MNYDVMTFDDVRDREQVVCLWQTVFSGDPPRNEPRAMIDRKLLVQPELFLVAREGERLLGTLVGGYDGVRGWMHHLATDPDSRRGGIGGALVAELEKRLRKLGCIKLNLQVREGNESVSGFYESQGYEREPIVSFGKAL